MWRLIRYFFYIMHIMGGFCHDEITLYTGCARRVTCSKILKEATIHHAVRRWLHGCTHPCTMYIYICAYVSVCVCVCVCVCVSMRLCRRADRTTGGLFPHSSRYALMASRALCIIIISPHGRSARGTFSQRQISFRRRQEMQRMHVYNVLYMRRCRFNRALWI